VDTNNSQENRPKTSDIHYPTQPSSYCPSNFHKRYSKDIGSRPGIFVHWLDQTINNDELQLKISDNLNEIQHNDFPSNLYRTKIQINYGLNKLATITIYYTTGTILIQGHKCSKWVDNEFKNITEVTRQVFIKSQENPTQDINNIVQTLLEHLPVPKTNTLMSSDVLIEDITDSEIDININGAMVVSTDNDTDTASSEEVEDLPHSNTTADDTDTATATNTSGGSPDVISGRDGDPIVSKADNTLAERSNNSISSNSTEGSNSDDATSGEQEFSTPSASNQDVSSTGSGVVDTAITVSNAHTSDHNDSGSTEILEDLLTLSVANTNADHTTEDVEVLHPDAADTNTTVSDEH
jgi:hypothetical protein